VLRVGRAQHDEEHLRAGRGFQRVRHVGGHAHDCAWRGGDSAPTNGQRKCTLDDENERVERRRVLTEALASVEREQGHIPTGRFGKHAAGDTLLGVCQQGA